MGNPPVTDRRFDKPSMESLVDLINLSNKSHILCGEIEADQITPVFGAETEPYNTTVRIRLKDADINAPSATMTYGRFDIAAYLPKPHVFVLDDLLETGPLFHQLKALHHIQLDLTECLVTVSEVVVEGVREVTFTPKASHPVWIGQLTVKTTPSNGPTQLPV